MRTQDVKDMCVGVTDLATYELSFEVLLGLH